MPTEQALLIGLNLKCEICGVTGKLDMHHVRKLKALGGKGYADKLMIARRGKTIALC